MRDLVTRYVIAGPTRTGTTAVSVMLSGHPAVASMPGELDPELFVKGLAIFKVNGYVTPQEVERGHRVLFDAITEVAAGPQTRARGAKTCINAPAMVRTMGRVLREHLPGTRIIVTLRADYVAHLGSRLHLRRTGVAHSWRAGADRAPQRIRIPKLYLARHVVAMERAYAAYGDMAEADALFWLDYEAFAADNRAMYRRLIDFLGLPYEDPAWMSSRKVLPAPDRYIERYAELTRYAQRIATRYREGQLTTAFLRLAGVYTRLYRLLHVRRPRSAKA